MFQQRHAVKSKMSSAKIKQTMNENATANQMFVYAISTYCCIRAIQKSINHFLMHSILDHFSLHV